MIRSPDVPENTLRDLAKLMAGLQ
jgi:hypothetical protein